MTTPIDTEYWKLGAWLDWKPTELNKPKFTACTHCNEGKVGGGFKSMDDVPRDCDFCHGSGGSLDYSEIPAKPEVPPVLVESMRTALFNFLNGSCSKGKDCMCNGDIPRVQQGCYNWKKGYAK